METDIVKTLQKDWKAAAAHLVKSSAKLVNNPLKHASDDRTLDLLELWQARQLLVALHKASEVLFELKLNLFEFFFRSRIQSYMNRFQS